MPSYRYQPGDRPLDGYTIRAPAGRGGFGEVYFAHSDAGREVALKALYNNQGGDEIELRGIRHCMNLKSPHLVSIFDMKTGTDGTPFVLMEYVAGPSLRDLLNDSPGGIGPDKAAFFLREVAKGLSHLHGYGVVHRDLKPANIFYEDGYVKIGDYGLAKLMSADPVASQTITVGTVHYMAPEIGAGKYDKSIDLYALGCLLYEMLTGKVPYAGQSPTEILIKHLQNEPDLSGIDEPFARVIRKAMQKDPANRYASAAEMVEDLFGTEHVRNSVSQLNAAELSVIAGRVGQKIDGPATDSPIQTPRPTRPQAPTPTPLSTAQPSTQSVWPDYTVQAYYGLVAIFFIAMCMGVDLAGALALVAFIALFTLIIPALWRYGHMRKALAHTQASTTNASNTFTTPQPAPRINTPPQTFATPEIPPRATPEAAHGSAHEDTPSKVRRWPKQPGMIFLITAVLLASIASAITAFVQPENGPEFFTCTLYLLLTVGPAVAWAASRTRSYLNVQPTIGYRLGVASIPTGMHMLVGSPVLFSLGGFPGQVVVGMSGVAFISMMICMFVYWPKYITPRRTHGFTPGLWITLGLTAALPIMVFVPGLIAAAFALPVIIALGAQLLSPPQVVQPETTTPPAPNPTSPHQS